MSQVLTIARRELSSLFVSPIGYLVMFLFLLFMGIIFLWRIFQPGQLISMRELVNFSRFGLFFIVPLLTMSVFSDEYRSGRIETLRTSPLSEFKLLMGKFLGTMGYFIVLLACSLVYLVILLTFGKPDIGQVVACYFGMGLMGCMFVAAGIFFSSCTKEPIVAALGSFMALGVLTLSDLVSSQVPSTLGFWGITLPLRSIFDFLTVGQHIDDFTRGSIELGSVVYFLGFSGIFLFWSYLVLESKKWR